MKINILKYVLIMAFSLLTASAFAQETETTKKLAEIPQGYMPEQGDFSIGINAKPILRYAGNIFNGTKDNSLTSFGGQFTGGTVLDMVGGAMPGVAAIMDPLTSISGKYMFSDKMAFRANVGLLGINVKDKQYVIDDRALFLNPDSREMVEDAMTVNAKGGSFALGVEFHRSYRKIMATGGVDLMYAFAGGNTKFSYGNDITGENQIPSIAGDFLMGDAQYQTVDYLPSARPLENYGLRYVQAFGLIGHVGIEWFFAPKISLGGEVTLSVLHFWQPQTYATYEGFNPQTQKVETYTKLNSPGTKAWLFGSQNIGGNIFVNFYF